MQPRGGLTLIQCSVAPAWLQMDSEIDVIGTAPINTPQAKVRLMLQNLLADRFRLALHQEMNASGHGDLRWSRETAN